MPGEKITLEPRPVEDEWTLPRWQESERSEVDGPCVVILYNDDYHDMEEVVSQVQKATGYDVDKCMQITIEAHLIGRAIAYSGSESECERCANILRQIRLQVETDRA